jgi:CheY-like chemotaxis protein
MKILLVDDDAFLRDMYATKFAEAGYEVIVSKNGPEAISMLKEQNDIDIVMLDMIMPGMSGLDLLGEIKNMDLQNTKTKEVDQLLAKTKDLHIKIQTELVEILKTI